MELTRGTKKIIQEAIETVDSEHRDDRIRLCEEFCRIVETRYTGGAMSYQLKRMGNSYPLELLLKNGWSIQDAIDSDLVVYLTSDWFMDNELKEHNGDFYKENRVIVKSIDGSETKLIKNIEQIQKLTVVSEEQLSEFGIEIVSDLSSTDLGNTQEISTWEQVSDDVAFLLREKIDWLSPFIIPENENDNPNYISQVLNFTEAQAKAKGIQISKTNSVKIPLKSTGPILEAIDKYLYDKTGQYII